MDLGLRDHVVCITGGGSGIGEAITRLCVEEGARPVIVSRSTPAVEALLRDLQGRSTDFVVARDGTVMHGLALVYVLRDLPEVRAFKIVQESLDLTCVELELAQGRPLDKALRDKIVTGFRQRLGAAVMIELTQVSAIALEKSGKFRYVVSKVL